MVEESKISAESLAEQLAGLGSAPPEPLPPKVEEEKGAADKKHKMFDYADVIRGHIRQDVDVATNFRATFQTLNGKEDLWLRKKTGDFTGQSVDYVASWYRNAELAVGLVSLTLGDNPIPLPAVQYDKDDPQDESVEQRMNLMLSRVPNVLLNKLQLHYSWFLERIAEEFSGGALKNG